MDRREFMASGAKASAVAAVAGVLPPVGAHAASMAAGLGQTKGSSGVSGLSVTGLTVNGLVDPVGVEPDDCSFAWKLRSAGRSAQQQGYRITVRRNDPYHGALAWDSGPVASGRQAFVSYGGRALIGNAAYVWSVSVQDAHGRWSQPARGGRFVTALRPSDWSARWLHPAALSTQADQVTYVRRVIHSPSGTLQRATISIAAAHTYQLFVGEALVDRGPSFCYPDEQYSRSVDVTALVRPGAPLTLGVLHRWYGPGQGRPESAPGVLAQLSLHYADGRVITFGTDATWKELPAEWLPAPQRNGDGEDFVEWVDGRATPVGWTDPHFDDAGWTPSVVRGPVGTAPFTGLFAQRTTTQDRAVLPISLRTLSNGSVVADFGAVYAARVRLSLRHGQDGRTIPMHVGYELDPDGQVSTLHGTQETNLSFSYISRGGAQTFEALTYLGFRYLQVDAPGEVLGRDQVMAVATHAAMPDGSMATFATGNRMLDAVWKLNAHSCLYCTHEQFVDTPTREKGQFLWDASNESEAVMRAYGDQNMSWQGLRDVARGQARYWPGGEVNAVYPNGDGARQFPTFTERYPEWLWRYYVATGDHDTAVLLYPVTKRIADYLWSARNAATGLLTGFAFGTNSDPVYGYDQSVNADTTSNVLGVNAFVRIAQLADLAGDTTSAALQRMRAAQLTAAVNARLVRADGVYIDGIKADGTQSAHASQEANALALAYGVVPASRIGTVGAYVASLGISVGPLHGLELLRALAEAQRWPDIVHTLTDTTTPGWAHILAKGGTFTWETWIPSDLIGDSMSHGWGSSALVAMQESLLGVTLATPPDDGRVVAHVAPPGDGLDSAQGTVPTIAGPITVNWRRRAAGFTLETEVPPNATALVWLPARTASSVREGGASIGHSPGTRLVSFAHGVAAVGVGSGSYTFTSID